MMTIKESGRVLPHPSAIFHSKTSMGRPWVDRTLSLLSYVKRGKVPFNSATVEATKFTGPHTSHMHQDIINACYNRAQLTWSSINIGGGYHLWSFEYENIPLSLLSIQYSPLSPSCPAQSCIEPTRNQSL
jgi:hypothetical protein